MEILRYVNENDLDDFNGHNLTLVELINRSSLINDWRYSTSKKEKSGFY